MARLKERHRQIPNGLKFSIDELHYQSNPFSSFNVIVNAVENLVRANPEIASAKGWPQDRVGIENWVDEYNAAICEANHWTEFYYDSGGGPRFEPVRPPEWPLWAKAIALMKDPTRDAGVGDTAARMIGAETSDAFKSFYQKTFGRPCGCVGRQKDWNNKYRYAG